MEKAPNLRFLSFDWDAVDTSSSKTEDSKDSYGFSFSDMDSSGDNYDGSEMYTRIQNNKQLQKSGWSAVPLNIEDLNISGTTSENKKVSDDTFAFKSKRKAKKAPLSQMQTECETEITTVVAKHTLSEFTDGSTGINEHGPDTNQTKTNRKKKKKKVKNKYSKVWKDRYEKFYKNKKKFILDIIREEEGPFVFKIQLQYNSANQKQPKVKNPKWKKLSDPTDKSLKVEEAKEIVKVWVNAPSDSDKLQTVDSQRAAEDISSKDDNSKLKSKLMSFFKKTQIQENESEVNAKPRRSRRRKKVTPLIRMNYDKIRIAKPKNNQIKAFVTVFSQEDGVKIYDYFYKLKSKRFSSVIYLITGDKVLKKHTIRQLKLHDLKMQKEEEQKQETEKRLNLSEGVIQEDEHENSDSTPPEDYDGDNESA